MLILGEDGNSVDEVSMCLFSPFVCALANFHSLV